MLDSISRLINESGLSEEEIIETKKMPTLLDQLPKGDRREAIYGGMQRMGSHPVHGTWTNIANIYLEYKDGVGPKGELRENGRRVLKA